MRGNLFTISKQFKLAGYVKFGCICDGPVYFGDKNDMYKLYIYVSAGIFGILC